MTTQPAGSPQFQDPQETSSRSVVSRFTPIRFIGDVLRLLAMITVSVYSIYLLLITTLSIGKIAQAEGYVLRLVGSVLLRPPTGTLSIAGGPDIGWPSGPIEGSFGAGLTVICLVAIVFLYYSFNVWEPIIEKRIVAVRACVGTDFWSWLSCVIQWILVIIELIVMIVFTFVAIAIVITNIAVAISAIIAAIASVFA